MQALLVVDVQNEFSPSGQRGIAEHPVALERILAHVAEARAEDRPIAWIRHHNRPHESPAFVPGSWGAEFSPDAGPQSGSGPEREFTKEVYGAFTGTSLGDWLRDLRVDEVLIVGFFAHMCVSTTAREALMRDLTVILDPAATGACDLSHPLLGRLPASEVVRSAFLQLENMGAKLLVPAAMR
jgi:nicotinamidase-related amidase